MMLLQYGVIQDQKKSIKIIAEPLKCVLLYRRRISIDYQKISNELLTDGNRTFTRNFHSL